MLFHEAHDHVFCLWCRVMLLYSWNLYVIRIKVLYVIRIDNLGLILNRIQGLTSFGLIIYRIHGLIYIYIYIYTHTYIDTLMLMLELKFFGYWLKSFNEIFS